VTVVVPAVEIVAGATNFVGCYFSVAPSRPSWYQAGSWGTRIAGFALLGLAASLP